MEKRTLKNEFKTFGGILTGSLVIAVGILYFIDPSGLYTGGVTGLAQLIVNSAKMISGGSLVINLGFLTFLFQIPLILLGYFKLSKRFIFYTLVSVIIVSALLALPISFPVMENDYLASAIVGGALTGLGNGILYKVGASSGGTAILFQYLSIKTGKSVGIYQIILHGIIIILAGIQFSLMVAVYTIVSQSISALVVDRVHTGYHFLKLEIITDSGKELAEAISLKMPHAATFFPAVGAYSGKEHSIIYAVISAHELSRYTEFIRSMDPKAFIVVSTASGVLGNFQKKNII